MPHEQARRESVSSRQMSLTNASTRTPRGLLVRAAAQIGVSTSALLGLYYAVPLDRADGAAVLGWLGAGLLAFVAVALVQVRGILRAPFPALKAITGLGVAVPLFVLIFASTYLTVAASDPTAFSERLSHTDALYFSLTIFSTVGFGDITPVSEGARIVASVQMVGDLLVLGLLARVVFGAVQESRRRIRGQQRTGREQ